MNDIEAFQSRILTAMDRLAAGIENLDGGTEAAKLKEALAEEKTVNAQLSERVRVLAERQEEALATVESKARESVDRVEALDMELQRLRQATTELQTICEALRQANEEGVGEPHLINRAMAAEIEAMKAMRQSEIAEADEIISALMPLLSQGNAAPAEEVSDA